MEDSAFKGCVALSQKAKDSLKKFKTDHLGWYTFAGHRYYVDMDGNMLKDTWKWIDGKSYYFYSDGHMASDETVHGWRVNKEGAWVPGRWYKNRRGWWYSYADGQYARNGLTHIGRYTYYFDHSGYMKTGWRSVAGEQLYFRQSGAMLKETWQWINKKCYYFRKDGSLAKDAFIDGSYVDAMGVWRRNYWSKNNRGWYYHYGNGALAKNDIIKIGNHSFLFDQYGLMQTGWRMVFDQKYYFDANGYMMTGGWKWINKKCYYFYSDGHVAVDEIVDSYYVNKDGVWLKNGWTKASDGWYYHYGFGKIARDGITQIHNRKYLFNAEGLMLTGFREVDGKTYYFDANGYMAMDGWKWINGKCYYFYPDGHMAIAEKIADSYVNNEGVWVPDTWLQSGSGWRYRFGDGTRAENVFCTIKGVRYYFGEDGLMYSDRMLQREDGTRYYFKHSGAMQTGWKKLNGRYYNFGSDGKLCNGRDGQKTPAHIVDVPGYYIMPLLADENNSRTERIDAMIQSGMEYIGTSYKAFWAGNPGTYCDSAGLVMQALYGAGCHYDGINPKTHAGEKTESVTIQKLWENKNMKTVSIQQRRRGDLVFYQDDQGTVNQVGIYLGHNRVLEEWPPCGEIHSLYWSKRNRVKGFKRPVK